MGDFFCPNSTEKHTAHVSICLRHSAQLCYSRNRDILYTPITVLLPATAQYLVLAQVASVFVHSTVKRFLKGLSNVFPPVREAVPLWDLSLVLTK